MKIVKKLNGVQILQRDDGKYGLQEIVDGEELEPSFRYKTLHQAEIIATSISDENSSISKYENSVK